MSIALLAFSFFLDRAGAGFPILKKWFPALRTDAQKAVEVEGNPAVAAAPAEIKTLVIDQLKKVRDGASVRMKIIYTFLISFAESAMDSIWDSIFQQIQDTDASVVTFGTPDEPIVTEVTKEEEKEIKALTAALPTK